MSCFTCWPVRLWRNNTGALEIKTDSGAVSPEQKAFLQLVRQLGGLGAVCRSIEQAQAGRLLTGQQVKQLLAEPGDQQKQISKL